MLPVRFCGAIVDILRLGLQGNSVQQNSGSYRAARPFNIRAGSCAASGEIVDRLLLLFQCQP
jgi:hypothetical protein